MLYHIIGAFGYNCRRRCWLTLSSKIIIGVVVVIGILVVKSALIRVEMSYEIRPVTPL